MGAAAAVTGAGAPHIPVLLAQVVEALAPVDGAVMVDATFGAGGYSRALLRAGARQVIGIDRDRTALDAAEAWAAGEPRLTLVNTVFSDLEQVVADHAEGALVGVTLDIGVSSMQLDQAARGFSFLRDGPLDMRMSGEGISAADLVNGASEAVLADVIFHLGEDRAARRIAKAIARARAEAEIETTGQLVTIVEGVLPPARPGQSHPATRTFQALRIAVNDELGELVSALAAAERALTPGGRLAVVSFHSLEDRIVKRYLQVAAAERGGGSRHTPVRELPPARYEKPRKPVKPRPDEIDANPRARSALLRSAVRTEAPPVPVDAKALGMPGVAPIAELMGRART
ncbi:MAG: 16S rRNA (cytosine(1402)-N(4))-methyltransferase RsmH [Pseudomonadota bacterium]